MEYSHTTQFTHLKFSIEWFFSIFTELYNYHHNQFQNITQKETSYPFFLPPMGNHSSMFCVCGFAYSGHFIKGESYNMWPFVSDFFHSACFQGSFMLYVSTLEAFLLLNKFHYIAKTIFCLSIHQLLNIWVVSTFWLFWIMLLWTFM